MIERDFGNFRGTVDPVSDRMHILGLRFGWKATYSLDELPSKIAFYKRLIAASEKRGAGRPVGFENTIKCLEWAYRVLSDD